MEHRARVAVFGSLSFIALVAAVLALSAPASAADVEITGDWNITGSLSYTNQVIQVNRTNVTNSTDGNVTIFAGGSLWLINCTLLLPSNSTFANHGTLIVVGGTIDGPAYAMVLNGTSALNGATIINATHQHFNSSVGGTYVSSALTTFSQVTWNQSNGGGAIVNMAVPLDFSNQTMRGGAGVNYLVDAGFANTTIEVAHNSFWNGTLGNPYSVRVTGATLPDPTQFEIHNNTFLSTLVAVALHRLDINGTYNVRDNFVNLSGFGIAVQPGGSFGGSRFHGNLNVSNMTILNGYVGVWLYGSTNRDTWIHLDRMNMVNVGYGITADDGFVVLTNSSITAVTATYEALGQGHILIYNSVGTAFHGPAPGNNASIEHFAFLNVQSFSWQNLVPFLNEGLALRNETGVVNLTLNTSWTPRLVVLWGMYSGGVRVDNRDLRPAVIDGTAVFACAPSQFYLADGMAPLVIACTDDQAPTLAGSTPAVGSFLNVSSFTLRGAAAENGSGMAIVEWSLDNASFSVLAGPGGDQFNWNVSQGPLADGAYTFYIRATDRTGNIAYLAWGPIRIDTVTPTILVDALPRFASGLTFDLTGSTEPFSTLTVRRAFGWNQTQAIPANGSYRVVVPVDEGQNTYTIIAVDRAGNRVQVDATIRVDTVAPAITFTVDGQPDHEVWTATGAVRVAGACEATATVTVNGGPTTRAGSSFERDVALLSGLNPLEVRCTDEAGNLAIAHGFAYFDDAAPQLALLIEAGIQLPSGDYRTRASAVLLSGTVSDTGSGLARLIVNSVDFAVAGDGSFAVSFSIAEGLSTITLSVVDYVGNTDTRSFQVTRDSVAPTATFEWQAAGSPVVESDAAFYTRGSTVRLLLDLSEPCTVTVGGSSHALPSGESTLDLPLSAGENAFTIEFNDTAGNPGAHAVMSITMDNQPPLVQIFTPETNQRLNEPAVEVTGNAGAGATATVNGQPVSLTQTGDFRVDVGLEPGSNVIIVVSKDALGNNASTSITVEYVIEAPPPTPGPSGGLEIPLLVVGLAAGVAVGALAMRGRRPRAAPGPSGPVEAHEESDDGDDEEIDALVPDTPKPKGPRGPQPP